MTDLAALPWRTGRSLGRTVYARTGGDDREADTVIGMLDTRELAEEACAAHNAELARRQAAKDPAVALLEEALFLRANGERPPGSPDATWRKWDLEAEVFLRSLLPEPDAAP
jgi:hypothetical protein